MSQNQKDRECPRCRVEAKLRLRDFSPQAQAALVAWDEMDKSVMGNPICDDCYAELREVLVDRADELAVSSSDVLHGSARAG